MHEISESNCIHSAVILTAGIGKRLRPLTDYVPKALFPINNRPALQLIIDKLKAISIDDFFFNTFHLADDVTGFLDRQTSLNKTIVLEQALRDTGGGIANFRDNLKDETFILHNCDVYSEEDLRNLIEYHFQQEAIATLMVVDFPPINSVCIIGGEVNGFSLNDGNLTYCGIAVISPRIWDYMPDEETFSLIPVLSDMTQDGQKIAAFFSRAYWNDFGTPLRYWELHRYLCSGRGEFIDDTAVVDNCDLKGFNFIAAGANIRDCVLEDCIVFPGAEIVGADIRRCLISRDCRIDSQQIKQI